MAYAIVLLSVLLMLVCALWGICAVMSSDEFPDDSIVEHEDDNMRRERARQAHYMRNFWNYDGSQQQEWDE